MSITTEDLFIWIEQQQERYHKEHLEAVEWRDWITCEFVLHDMEVLKRLSEIVELHAAWDDLHKTLFPEEDGASTRARIERELENEGLA